MWMSDINFPHQKCIIHCISISHPTKLILDSQIYSKCGYGGRSTPWWDGSINLTKQCWLSLPINIIVQFRFWPYYQTTLIKVSHFMMSTKRSIYTVKGLHHADSVVPNIIMIDSNFKAEAAQIGDLHFQISILYAHSKTDFIVLNHHDFFCKCTTFHIAIKYLSNNTPDKG